MNFGQLITAMVTPFDYANEIDFPATKNLINHLIENGTDAIIVAGTTGESPTLTMKEKVELFQFVVRAVNQRVPVLAGTGTNCTEESIHLTKEAEKAGVDGLMLVTPYYNRPSQAGLFAHFKAIAQTTDLPIMLYNIPGRSAVNMSVETIVSLSELHNIIAVKEASGDLNAMTRIVRETSNDFLLYSGDDNLTLPVLAIGGTGVVSVSSHVIGNEMKEMMTAFMDGNVQKAAIIHQELLPVMDAMFSAPSPTPIKTALNMINMKVGDVRLPLISLCDEEKTTLKHALQRNKTMTELVH